MKYLRSTTNGFVFEYNERLANLPEWQEVTEKEAFPERFAPVDLATREQKVVIDVPASIADPPPVVVSPELEAEATRSFGKNKGTRARSTGEGTSAAPAPSFDIVGLNGAF